jgi:Fe2+ or Zn2+ uptake regulation protein
VRRAERAQLHDRVALRLASLDQRYTANRRGLVDALAVADRPLPIADLVAHAGVPLSSAYRNLIVLAEAGVVRRVVASAASADDAGRFELSEELSGRHHHHLVCGSCGDVADVESSPKLERALADAARTAVEGTGYEVFDHRIDLVGRCPACR